MRVAFNERVVGKGEHVELGGTRAPPCVAVENAEPGVHYAVYCYDPDAPLVGRPFLSDIPHLLIVNLTKEQPACANALQTQRIVSWRPPRPPVGSHRYIFVLCVQTGGVLRTLAAPRHLRERSDAYLLASNLRPVAASYFSTRRVWGLAGPFVFFALAVATAAVLRLS